jgi:hypothetical protein
MSNGKKPVEPNWRIGIGPAIACGVFVYIMEQILYRQGAEEGVDIAIVMYDFGSKVVKRVHDNKTDRDSSYDEYDEYDY